MGGLADPQSGDFSRRERGSSTGRSRVSDPGDRCLGDEIVTNGTEAVGGLGQ